MEVKKHLVMDASLFINIHYNLNEISSSDLIMFSPKPNVILKTKTKRKQKQAHEALFKPLFQVVQESLETL